MKIDRLLAITILILNRGRISAKELADRFEVSTKTIYRDMEALNQAGIPIVAHQGTAGGYDILEHFTIARQYLSLDEITSVLTAVRGIGTVLDDATFASVLEKVKALLHKSDRAQWERQNDPIVLDLNPWGQGEEARNKVNVLKQAIHETRKVVLRYIDKDGTESDRVAEPYALILKGNVWYVQAFCTLRDDFRVFRLSRVRHLRDLPERFDKRTAPPLDGYSWEPGWSKHKEKTMVLAFQPEVRHRVGDTFHPDQVTDMPDGSMRVTGQFPEDEWFYGMVLSYGDGVKVESPEEVAKEVVDRAKKIVGRYAN
ncbi:helix-turn-helix transcriptional regulator [Paenibacillus sp. MBLB4367]|uniref:helix-turn-helix transcriptional regulator n=1 Tax=Paenibacillus sp. MBLB4367 TaxID=3384767 RepID=UPI0039082CA5